MFSLPKVSPILINRLITFNVGFVNSVRQSSETKDGQPGSDAYPIIPRIRTILPHPLQVPHPRIVDLIRDAEKWCKSIASGSIVDDQTRAYIDNMDSKHMWDTPCMYIAFAINPNCSYETLFELSKNVILAQFVDEMVEYEQQNLVTEQLYDYMVQFQKNPDLVHDPTGDKNRHFWINLLGHSVNGLRNGGMTKNHIRREIKALENYTKITTSRDRPEVDWNNYWTTRIKNANMEVVTIPAESVGGVDLPDQLADDPNVRIAINASYKLNIIVNDLVSYFRERNTDENSFNFVTFIQGRTAGGVQEAVDQTAEHVIVIHDELVASTKAALRSPAARKYPQLDPFLKYVVPRYTYGEMTTYEVLNRNRMGRQRPDYDQMLKSGRWACDDLFVNDSDPNNGGRKFDEYLEKYSHLKDQVQEYI